MLSTIFKAITDTLQGKPLFLRSTKWRKVRKTFLKTHPLCAGCGREVNLEVHHIKPFHLFPELELKQDNLIVLCEEKDTKCHLMLGHRGNWRTDNPDVVLDSASFLAKWIVKI